MKFNGIVGFWEEDVEVKPGVYRSQVKEIPYKGNIVVDSRRNNDQEFKINNRISIIADMYMQNNWPSIKYVVWNGRKLRVTAVTMDHPRVTVELGGNYDGTTENGTT